MWHGVGGWDCVACLEFSCEMMEDMSVPLSGDCGPISAGCVFVLVLLIQSAGVMVSQILCATRLSRPSCSLHRSNTAWWRFDRINWLKRRTFN